MKITDDFEKQCIIKDPRDVRLDELIKAYNELQWVTGEALTTRNHRIQELLKENKRLKEALLFYANYSNWGMEDPNYDTHCGSLLTTEDGWMVAERALEEK